MDDISNKRQDLVVSTIVADLVSGNGIWLDHFVTLDLNLQGPVSYDFVDLCEWVEVSLQTGFDSSLIGSQIMVRFGENIPLVLSFPEEPIRGTGPRGLIKREDLPECMVARWEQPGLGVRTVTAELRSESKIVGPVLLLVSAIKCV